ncbi:hypothetical protein [Cardinium endosymbiont of Philonthus spinipes]|uniref:hypothetical protein n=1 Tax=Cardinium endosymbiont of Philonthus spinipes TaxID=3077941 RepID=UPI00313DCBE5
MEKQKSPAARASKESVFPNHLQGMRPISQLFTGAFFVTIQRCGFLGLQNLK